MKTNPKSAQMLISIWYYLQLLCKTLNPQRIFQNRQIYCPQVSSCQIPSLPPQLRQTFKHALVSDGGVHFSFMHNKNTDHYLL